MSNIKLAIDNAEEFKAEPPLPEFDEGEMAKKIARLNEHHAVVMQGGSCRVMNLGTDPQTGHPSISFSTESDFRLRYKNETVCVGNEEVGKPKFVPLAKAWLENKDRRKYGGVLFLPVAEMPGYYCPSSRHLGHMILFHMGGPGSSRFDVKPLGVDGSSGALGWSVS